MAEEIYNKSITPQLRYDRAHCRQITFKFNRDYDADILEKLDEVENRQGYIKELIRADISRNG